GKAREDGVLEMRTEDHLHDRSVVLGDDVVAAPGRDAVGRGTQRLHLVGAQQRRNGEESLLGQREAFGFGESHGRSGSGSCACSHGTTSPSRSTAGCSAVRKPSSWK